MPSEFRGFLAYLTLGLLEEATVHLARAAHRSSGFHKWNSRSVTSDEQSWVPSKTVTQRSSQSARFACVVAQGHVSTFAIPEKHLYTNNHDGTEPSQSHPPPCVLDCPRLVVCNFVQRDGVNKIEWGTLLTRQGKKRCSTPRQVTAHRGTLYAFQQQQDT